MNEHIFISHCTEDDGFVKDLRQGLGMQGLTAWVDSRGLTGGDELVKEIKTAIREARAFIIKGKGTDS